MRQQDLSNTLLYLFFHLLAHFTEACKAILAVSPLASVTATLTVSITAGATIATTTVSAATKTGKGLTNCIALIFAGFFNLGDLIIKQLQLLLHVFAGQQLKRATAATKTTKTTKTTSKPTTTSTATLGLQVTCSHGNY
ncbi:MAG: hypothetical protein CMJ75_18520 [Planctomycetaceae bacterium]|nr:hypothetical protein [Planctomycetaceae bacterium]